MNFPAALRGLRTRLTRPRPVPQQPLLDAEPWTIDELQISREGELVRVDMRGWALPDPELGAASPGRFLINGELFRQIEYPIQREDVEQAIWMRRQARYSGFHCISEGPADRIYRDGIMGLTYVNPGPRRRVPAQQSWFYFDPEREGPIPEPARRYRVIANDNASGFLRSGFTDFKRLDAAAAALAGRGFAGRGRILDWGCGCGRLARYAAALPGVELSGCDIDADNVSWCAAHLQGRYAPCGLHPPLPFAGTSFDLIYGLSVFTHLREPLQDEWLAELHRVAAPGALLLMTVHGQTALDYSGVVPQEHAELARLIRARGIHQTGGNDQLHGFVEQPDEYVTVFHDRDYVRARWGKRFEILGILPGYIYTHDLVVLRKPAA